MTPRERKKDWVPYVGMALAAAGYIFQGGQLTSQLHSTTERVVKLEAAVDSFQTGFQTMNERGARNEERLNFLVQQAREDDARRGRR